MAAEWTQKDVREALERVISAFVPVLYEDDETFLANMRAKGADELTIRRCQHWEWTQGVGLFGFWRLYAATGKQEYLDILTRFYEAQLEVGLPEKNINTTAPMLALSYLAEKTGDARYLALCDEWAESIMEEYPRTSEGGLQHKTSDCENSGELWDDTLFMTVLFLANMGRIRGRQDYLGEAQYQFLLHAKYLTDKRTGLWFHGWTFAGHHNFAEALWGRGNCWVTMAIPELLGGCAVAAPVQKLLTGSLAAQAEALARFQGEDGMWHTLVDDPSSYAEASATCGFAYGLLRAVKLGLVEEHYRENALRAVTPILACISPEGRVTQVSYGTPMGRESKDFYKQIPLMPMPYGQALLMLFFLEVLGE